MSISLVREPEDLFWTTSPSDGHTYRLLSIIVSDDTQPLAALSEEGIIVTVDEAAVNGGATYTTAYEATDDQTTTVVFPYVSRYTLQGEAAPGHDTFYLGLSGLQTDVISGAVYTYLVDNGSVFADFRSAPLADIAGFVEETVNDPSSPASKVIQRTAVSYDKRDVSLPGADSSYLADNGNPYILMENVTNVPIGTTAVEYLFQSNYPTTLYSVPEDSPIVPDTVKYVWAPGLIGGTEWLVTSAGARLSNMSFSSLMETPPKENSYLAFYGGALANYTTPIPTDYGAPMAIPAADGLVIGGAASGYARAADLPFNKYPVDVATNFPGFGSVLTDTEADEVSYLQLIPMLTVVPVTFTSSDAYFGPYLAGIITLTVGDDVYPYDAEYGGFVIDMTNESTRSLVSATNVTLTGTVTVNDTLNLLSTVAVNGSASPFPAITIPLNNIPSIVFTGQTKAYNGDGYSTGAIVIGGVALFLIIAMIIAGIAAARRS